MYGECGDDAGGGGDGGYRKLSCQIILNQINIKMPYLFALLLLACFVLIVIGLIKPATVLFWNKKNPTRGKVILWYGLGIFICFIVIGVTAPEVKKVQQASESKFEPSVDSSKKVNVNTAADIPILSEEQKLQKVLDEDKSYQEKEIKLDETTLSIAVASKGKPPSALYYLNVLNLSDSNIGRVKVFKYNSKNSLVNGSYNNPASDELSDWAIKKLKEDWETQNLSAWYGSCRPVEKYIKNNMNDPDSYEHVETQYRFDRATNSFFVVSRFRGKNAFGGKVLNNAKAYVSLDGSVISFEIVN